MIVSAFSNSKLSFEVLERKNDGWPMGGIEFLIVLAMASLYFSIVSWCVGLDQLVTNIKLLQGFFKERWLGIFSTNQPICEFAAIICLHTFDGVSPMFSLLLSAYIRSMAISVAAAGSAPCIRQTVLTCVRLG